MVEEVMAALSPVPGSFQIDATVGGGGHALRILEASTPGGRLLGLDADQAAIARTRQRLERFGDRAILRQANFEQLMQVASETGADLVDGVFFDLGLSSQQLADADRSFSFRAEGPLDMRFDTSRGRPAHELLEDLDERELSDLLRRYGEEPHARRISAAIVAQRGGALLRTGRQLAELVERSVPSHRHVRKDVHGGSRPDGRRRIHPATRVFQALRIAVNRELETLPEALAAAVTLLRPEGRLAVISYHSLEDRIVKRFVTTERRGCVCPPAFPVCVCGRAARLSPVGPQPQRPSEAEVSANPRSRSAHLRVARRLAA
ncbi:MAG: 16S rRNA (cytosine(1402)-N(4))-methyltransferase RsmH [Chloroflexi bacterium]|nr:16S rRNA (cytosine(1402)-N(4))-methyltransferase RsmH [Chloroflexota bacterium]